MFESMFDSQEIAVMMMCLEHYVDMPECTESEQVKNELRNCTRKLHALIDLEAEVIEDEPYPFPRIPEVEEWEKQREQVNPNYAMQLEDTDDLKENSDLFK